MAPDPLPFGTPATAACLAALRAAARPPVARCATCLASCLYCGSRSLRSASTGVAMQIEEYVPESMPTNSTSDRSFSSPLPSSSVPTIRIAVTGSSAMSEVLMDRTSVWFSARLAASL